MVTVTERAKERLLEQKQAARIEDAEIGLRVSADSTGQWMLIADHARDDDQVVEHRGSTVLLIDPVAQSVLEGTQVTASRPRTARWSWCSGRRRTTTTTSRR
jgi:Fe-S cluster assembly iron-binding protein IscA